MVSQRLGAIVVAIATLLLAGLAFAQQQGAAHNEATAIANAEAAGTTQSEAVAARQTAVSQMNDQSTAQAQAEASRAAAEMSAEQAAATAVAALAQATEQAGIAGQAQVEASQQAEIAAQAQTAAAEQAATATISQREAIRQAATSQVLQVELTEQSSQLATEQNLATSYAVELGATVHAAQTQAAQAAVRATDAIASLQGTLSIVEAQVAAPVAPEAVIRFLVEQAVVPEDTGSVASRLGETAIDLGGRTDWMEWVYLPGYYRDFVMSSDIRWGSGSPSDDCGFVLRVADDDNHYFVGFNRLGYAYFYDRVNGIFEEAEFYADTPSIRTAPADKNQLIVVGLGSTFTIYLNGELVATLNHDRITEGRLGVEAGTDRGLQGAGCTFQNTWVWNLPPQNLTATPENRDE